MIELFTQTMSHVATVDYWWAFLMGLALATAIGLIPGIGSTVTMAIALPIVVMTFEEPAIGVVMLAVITGTGNTLDSIPAQLMGITSGGTQVSFLEGHQLARKGLAAYSLGAVYAVSAIGGIVGAFALLVVMQIAGPLIILMGYPEIAVLSLFGLSMIAVLSKGAMLKGLASAAFGVLLGTVGMQLFTNTDRFTFGIYDMRGGLPLVALVVGLMAIPEMIDLAAARKPVAPRNAVMSNREVFRGFREGLRHWKLAVRHSTIGVLMGALPGTGGSFVTWMSYGIGIAGTKDPKDRSEFGKGSLKGLMFAESAENAKEGGQAIPSLALGIPGSTSWALVIAALLSYGLAPGPQLLQNRSDIIWLIVFSFAMANLIMTMIALVSTRQVIRITQIPYPAIIATTLPIMVLGSYFSDPNSVVIPVLVLMSLVGLMMKMFRWPRPPLILGFILAAPIEENLFTAVNFFGVVGVFTRPFTIVMGLLGIFIVWRLLVSRMRADSIVEGRIEAVADETHAEESWEVLKERAGWRGYGSGSAVVVSSGRWKPAMPRLHWGLQNWVALAFVVLGLYVLSVTLDYPRMGAKLLPSMMAGLIVLTAGAHLVMITLNRNAGSDDILDIAMLSTGMDGAKLAALKMLGSTLLYLLLIYAIGLKLAGLSFAVIIPFLFMKGRARFVTAAVAIGFYLLFAGFIGDNLLNLRWPGGWFM